MPYSAEVLLHLGERQDVIDCLLARGQSAMGEDVNAECACRQLAARCSSVVQLPTNLPELELVGWETASYSLFREECIAIAAELDVRVLQQLSALPSWPLTSTLPLQAYNSWASNSIQLDRAGQSKHAPSTVAKTHESIRRVLGFAVHVYILPGPVALNWLLNGNVLAAYARFSLDVRCARSPACTSARVLTPATPATAYLLLQPVIWEMLFVCKSIYTLRPRTRRRRPISCSCR